MTDKTSRNKDSRLVLGILFTFFAIVFAINFTYIYISQKTWRGIYTPDSYRKGLEYNKTLEYVNSKNNAGELTACLFDKNHHAIKDAKLVAKIIRPTQEGYDFTQDLMPQNDCYFAKINFPLKGQWVFEIQAFKGDDIFQEVKRYVVQ